jgi:PHP family Zn ribbon phosphoesterase
MVDKDPSTASRLNPTVDGFDFEAVCPYCDAQFQFTNAVKNNFYCPSCGEPIDAHSANPATKN